MLLFLATAATLLLLPNLSFGQVSPNLGTASTFSLFTAAGAFNGDVATSVIGDIGTNAGAFVPPGVLVGNIHVPPDPAAVLAATDVTAAYTALDVNNPCAIVLGTPFGNQTLTPNVYCLGGASVLAGNLTLNASGNPNAVFVFKVGGALSTDPLSTITLIGGASLCNVYFWVDGAVELGSNSVFQGTIIAGGAISLLSGAVLQGRGLSTAGAISTNANVVELPAACAGAGPGPGLPPTITCLAPVTVSCTSQVPAANPNSVVVTVTCPGPFTVISLGDVLSNQTCANRYTIARTYQVTDACGNMANCAQTITVNDQTAPTIACPANVAATCASQVPAGDPAAVTTSDNCGGAVTVTFADVISNQTCANRFTITRTYRATDDCGNFAECVQTITVNDQTGPSITCLANVSVSCANQVPAADPTIVTTSDNCGGAVTVVFVGDVISNQVCADRFTITRTYQATDLCGNVSVCVQTIMVNGIMSASIICPANVTVLCASQVPTADPASVTVGVTCGGQVTVTSADVITNQTCPNRFTITRTYTVTDACGNMAVCAQTIMVNDQTLPTINCPANVSVSCASRVPAGSTTAPTIGDNCGGAVTVTFANAITNQTCANRFTNTRTYSAVDACGNRANCVQIITVLDQSLPNINCPANVTVSCVGLVPVANTATVTASDNCGGVAVVTLLGDAITNQICANRFTNTRTYSAVDACGNRANCAQIITVLDQTLPTITCPANVSVSCASQMPTGNTNVVMTSDNCGGGAVTVTFGNAITNQTCANRFTNTRTYTAIDACGNMATCAQIITVFNNAPPILTCPANVTVTCAGNVPPPAPATVLATDLCGGAVTVLSVGDVTNAMTCANRLIITRGYRATDLCGNFAVCAQTITVNDQTPPAVVCPANVTVLCASQVPVANPVSLTTTDNCSGAAATVTFLGDVVANHTCANRFSIARTYRASDLCGNSATCVQNITVFDQTPPTMVCPANLSVSCTAQMPAANVASVVANDACGGGTVTMTLVGEVMSNQVCANQYVMTRTYQATDRCGNTFACAQTIAVNDQTGPIFTILPQNLSIECTTNTDAEAEISKWRLNFGGAKVSSQCGATAGITTQSYFISETPWCGGSSATFTRTYEFRATDACGNVKSMSATFSLADNTPPVIQCPPGNLLLTCEHDLPTPDPSAVVAYDNCGGSVKLMLTISSVGTGCVGYQRSVNYWYMATDECGNMSNCDQSFQIMDSIPPLYNGPATINVSCVDDLPGAGDVTTILAPYMTDNCSDIICLGRLTPQNGLQSVTYCVKAKDLCGNWSDKFDVTFLATGVCQPLCTASQTIWGTQNSTIGGIATAEAVDTFLNHYAGIKAGKLAKSVTITSADCLLNLLPGNGTTAQFSPGKHTFGVDNDCEPSSPLLNSNGGLKNALAANVMAMQMNIWYNLYFNDRVLGVQRLANLPTCLVANIVLDKLETDQTSVQGLLNISNDYLAGVGFFPQGFGDSLNSALENLNNYWQNCQLNDVCSIEMRGVSQPASQLSQVRLAPNPVSDVVTITFEAATDTDLQVRFIGSTSILEEDLIQVVKGSNTLSFSTKTFPAGVYSVVLQDGNALQTLRMVKIGD